MADAQHIRAVIDDIEDTYRAVGSGAAWGKFVSLVMHRGPYRGRRPAGDLAAAGDGERAVARPRADGDAGGPPEPPSEKQQAEDELFFLRMLKPFTRYEPKVDQLRSGAPRVVVAVGEASRGEIAAARPSRWPSSWAGPGVFPGDHGGFMADPAGFAAKIREVLSRRTP